MQKVANINGVPTKYDLVGRSKDSYNNFKNLKYIGEGIITQNYYGKVSAKVDRLNHFFIHI